MAYYLYEPGLGQGGGSRGRSTCHYVLECYSGRETLLLWMRIFSFLTILIKMMDARSGNSALILVVVVYFSKSAKFKTVDMTTSN